MRAISSEIIFLQLKMTGCHLPLFGIYCPHDDHDIDVRQDFFDELHSLHAEYSRGGPVGYCGDFNNKIKTRTPDERAFFGPFLFNPPPVDAAAPPPQPTNLVLLEVSAILRASSERYYPLHPRARPHTRCGRVKNNLKGSFRSTPGVHIARLTRP